MNRPRITRFPALGVALLLAACTRPDTVDLAPADPGAADPDLADDGTPLDSGPHACPATLQVTGTDLGEVAVGQEAVQQVVVTNAGAGPLTVREVTFHGAEGFALRWPCRRGTADASVWEAVPSAPRVIGPEVCDPIVLEPGASLAVPVKLAPACAGDPQSPCPPPACMTLSLGLEPPCADGVTGQGPTFQVCANQVVDPQCPSCEFRMTAGGVEVPDGGEVAAVPATLGLEDRSVDPANPGPVAHRLWSVQGPTGGSVPLVPDPVAQAPVFGANVAGFYVVSLQVQGASGCKATCAKSLSVGPPDCLVKLTWTPVPPGPCAGTQDCGPDLDLHVVHPSAAGPDLDGDGEADGYYDKNWDCFWFDSNPTWDANHAGNPAFQPHCTRDGTYGGGPESFVYWNPPAGLCFKVGVHVWDDDGAGKATPRVQVSVGNATIYDRQLDTGLNLFDLWEVGSVCCADGTFLEQKTADGQPVVIPNYLNPGFHFTP